MRRLLLWISLLVAVAGLGVGWWAFFHDRSPEAAWQFDRHPAQLQQILSIIRANPDLCGVTLKGEPLGCLRTPSARDRADYARIISLMQEIGAHQMELRWGYDGNFNSVRLWMFDDPITNGGVAAFWGDGPSQGCRPLKAPGWRVCNVKGFIIFF